MQPPGRYEIAYEPDLIVEIRFLRTELGGRRNPVLSGYRCSHDFGDVFDGRPCLNNAMHMFDGDELLLLGETRRSRMRFLAPERHLKRLYPGFGFTLQEAHHIVGVGTVIEVTNPRLRKVDGDHE